MVCFISGIKTEYSVKPLTISDVGHSLHAMSQTLCQQADDENVGANDLSTQACEPTVGELLAKQVRFTVMGVEHVNILK